MGYHDNEATTKKAVEDSQRFINDRERYRYALSLLGATEEIIQQIRKGDFTGVMALRTSKPSAVPDALIDQLWKWADDNSFVVNGPGPEEVHRCVQLADLKEKLAAAQQGGDYSSVHVCEGEITHWMPLPATPEQQSAQAREE